jgi:hypothetical protein
MKRAVLYARVSTDAQQKEGTIESQVLELKRQIAAAGDVLVKKYIDDGYSGSLLDRPGIEALRRDVRSLLREIGAPPARGGSVSDPVLWLKGLHIMGFIAWMAGLWYLHAVPQIEHERPIAQRLDDALRLPAGDLAAGDQRGRIKVALQTDGGQSLPCPT